MGLVQCLEVLRPRQSRSRGRAQSRKDKAHRGQTQCRAAPATRGEQTRSKRTTTASRTPGCRSPSRGHTSPCALLPTGVRLLLGRRASHTNDGTLRGVTMHLESSTWRRDDVGDLFVGDFTCGDGVGDLFVGDLSCGDERRSVNGGARSRHYAGDVADEVGRNDLLHKAGLTSL